MSDVFNGYNWYPLTRSCNFSHLIDSTLPFFNDEKGRAVFKFFFFKWKEQTKKKKKTRLQEFYLEHNLCNIK